MVMETAWLFNDAANDIARCYLADDNLMAAE
jgi:hypothetical protein